MNKHEAVMMFGQMLAASGLDWREDGFIVEKSNLPKKEPMPLTEQELSKLSIVSGKDKKKYLKELRLKYESNH